MGKLEAEAVVPVAEAAGQAYQHAGERPIANTELDFEVLQGRVVVLHPETTVPAGFRSVGLPCWQSI